MVIINKLVRTHSTNHLLEYASQPPSKLYNVVEVSIVVMVEHTFLGLHKIFQDKDSPLLVQETVCNGESWIEFELMLSCLHLVNKREGESVSQMMAYDIILELLINLKYNSIIYNQINYMYVLVIVLDSSLRG